MNCAISRPALLLSACVDNVGFLWRSGCNTGLQKYFDKHFVQPATSEVTICIQSGINGSDMEKQYLKVKKVPKDKLFF